MAATDAAQQAARLTDPAGHSLGLLGMIAGAIVGAVVGAMLIAGAIATGGALLIALSAAAAGACVAGGGLSGGQLVRGIQTAAGLSNPTTGNITAVGSQNILIGNLPAARAVADMVAPCSGLGGLFHPSWAFPTDSIAEGAQKVLLNNLPAARVTSKLVCGAEITHGDATVLFGGPTVRLLDVDDTEEMLQKGLTYLLYGSLAAAFILTIPFGAAAVGEFLAVGGLFLGGFAILGRIGDAIGPGWRDILQGAFGLGTIVAGGMRARSRLGRVELISRAGDLEAPRGGVRPNEIGPDGKVLIHPELQKGRPGEPIALDPNRRYLWVVDKQGDVLVAPNEGFGNNPRAGHPNLTGGDPARIGGELNHDPATGDWVMNNDSGRYGFQESRTPENLDAAKDLLQDTGTEAPIRTQWLEPRR